MQLAKKGIGSTRPNPSVGAVIVWNDIILGEGFTSPYGGKHAEVNAIEAVKDISKLEEATIYVTMEPCAHYGKTPPCADLIVKTKLKNVVIGCLDSNSLVAGKGVDILEKAGCSVTIGVLEEACRAHHRRFFTVQEKKRPYIILKWAETKNGFIAPLKKKLIAPVWISNGYSQQLVHKWRAQEQAILVGTNTVVTDNPTLNVRSWKGQDPVVIVLDKNLRISKKSNVLNSKKKTIVFTKKNIAKPAAVEQVFFEGIDFSGQIATQICEVLQKHKIQSVIIEGGLKTLQTFIDGNLWDEARIFVGQQHFKEGVASPIIAGELIDEYSINGDEVKILRND